MGSILIYWIIIFSISTKDTVATVLSYRHCRGSLRFFIVGVKAVDNLHYIGVGNVSEASLHVVVQVQVVLFVIFL